MRKLTKLFVGFSVLAVLMICMTAVSFAGAKTDKVTVMFKAGMPGQYDFWNEVTVTGDMFEKAYPDLADADKVQGVSFADALVAAHNDRYGETDPKEHMGFSNGSWGLSVTKQFDHDIVGFYYANNASTPVGVGEYEIKDGDNLFAGAYSDFNYSDLYSYFDKEDVTTSVGKTITLKVTAGSSLGTEYAQTASLENASIKELDWISGELKDIKAKGTYEYKDGVVTLKFDEAGLYVIALDGKAKVTNWEGKEVEVGSVGAVAAIEVKPGKAAIKSAKRTAKKKAVVAWKAVKGAKTYEVQYRKAGAKKWTTKTTKKTKITLKKLNAKKKYQVRVRATDGQGGAYGKWSKAKTIKIKK